MARATPSRRRLRSRSKGLQITRVGVWYLAACAVVGAAAINTGNNGLFLAVAMMTAALLVIHFLADLNVRRLTVDVACRRELFANRMGRFEVKLRNRSRYFPACLLSVSIEKDDLQGPSPVAKHRTAPWHVLALEAEKGAAGRLDLIVPRRGLYRIGAVQVTSLFPNGIFRKGRRFEQDLEILVYPEIFQAAEGRRDARGELGDQPILAPGQGDELYALREYRPGDDPRGIHWKQSARQGELIFRRRSREQNPRLRVFFDNAVGVLESDEEKTRFERLVSEAATSAVHHLGRGFEVALITRDVELPFGSGPRQRRNILEALARIEALPEDAAPLLPEEDRQGDVKLAMDTQAMAIQAGAA